MFANTDRTADAAAGAASLSCGQYGPLLLPDSAKELPPSSTSYLLDIQPGYRFDPVRGVYNHAWLMGDESAISVDLQARIDELMEIVRIKSPGDVSGAEPPDRLRRTAASRSRTSGRSTGPPPPTSRFRSATAIRA